MNWNNLISDLQSIGITQSEMAQECGCSQATISELLCSPTKQPAHPLGEALIKIHARNRKKIRPELVKKQSLKASEQAA